MNKISVIESIIDLDEPEASKDYAMWDNGDCSEIGLCEILLKQLIREHKNKNKEYYNTDYDKIILRY